MAKNSQPPKAARPLTAPKLLKLIPPRIHPGLARACEAFFRALAPDAADEPPPPTVH